LVFAMEAVLSYLAEVFNYIVEELEYILKYPQDFFSLEQLEEIELMFFKGLDREYIFQEFIQKYPESDSELVYLVVNKIGDQGGVLDPMDRLFLKILED
jgi:hypothetical protein